MDVVRNGSRSWAALSPTWHSAPRNCRAGVKLLWDRSFAWGPAVKARDTEELAGSFVPVVVQFDDYVQIAFETQREPDGKVAVYLPGAPNPSQVLSSTFLTRE
jgi:hypothetical protein